MARILELLDGRYLPGGKPVAVSFAKRTLHGRRGSGYEFCSHAVQRSVSWQLCGCRQAIYFLRIRAETNSGRWFDHGRRLRSCDVPGEAHQSHRNIAARGRQPELRNASSPRSPSPDCRRHERRKYLPDQESERCSARGGTSSNERGRDSKKAGRRARASRARNDGSLTPRSPPPPPAATATSRWSPVAATSPAGCASARSFR
jgi:hypothetical protein